ncbi:hypothetical protein [Sphingobium sp. B11D3A]|uniref:hypothetical protein n=1 Tax=Sphingobium sp. B11D3A TaxID=2940574 RepID=UPI002224E797|nr:hypothetical protein [Sphingobium sp. B11D3A]MCW2393558.1 hypothetical protein [Sphingobium sp. B11D3A]
MSDPYHPSRDPHHSMYWNQDSSRSNYAAYRRGSELPGVHRRIEPSDDPRIFWGIVAVMAVGFVVITLAFFKVF